MSTTAILVEILIVGLQTCLWLTLIIVVFFGYDWIVPTAKAVKGWESLLSIFILGICYTIGVVFDRVADCVFIILKPHKILMKSNWIRKHAEVAHSDPRMEVLNSENKAVDFLENIRSRVRIARSTALNSLLVTSFCILFLILRTDYTSWKILSCVLFLGGFVSLSALLILGVLEVTFQKRLSQTHYAMNSKDKKPT
ncbi:MAG: hypothetical protein GY797_41305 [Deltaproteobacteria bacterium]|nr:hypothetical protein [Deltaproteobacteria bacterium]